MASKKNSVPEYVCKSEILEMFEDTKKNFNDQLPMLLLPINTEIASLKSELRSRYVAISALQNEVAAVKSPNAELMSENKKLQKSDLIPRNSRNSALFFFFIALLKIL